MTFYNGTGMNEGHMSGDTDFKSNGKSKNINQWSFTLVQAFQH